MTHIVWESSKPLTIFWGKPSDALYNDSCAYVVKMPIGTKTYRGWVRTDGTKLSTDHATLDEAKEWCEVMWRLQGTNYPRVESSETRGDENESE